MDNVENVVNSVIGELDSGIKSKKSDKKKKGNDKGKNRGKKKDSERYNYYWNKYARKLGLSRSNIDVTTWSIGKRGRKIKSKTGVDFRECYNLDHTLALYIYSRLKAYKKYTVCDLEYDKDRDFGDVHGTMRQAIDEVLKGLKLYLKEQTVMTGDEKYLDKCKEYLGLTEVDETFEWKAPLLVCRRAFIILADLVPSLWD